MMIIRLVLLGIAASAATTLAAPVTAPQALDAGPHHIRWRTTNQIQTPQGLVNVPSEFVQLESGLNRWDQNSASWVPTDPAIELFQDGAIVRNLQYSVIFSPNLTDPAGALDILLPDGQSRLRGQIMGIAYTLGPQSVLVAEIRDCVGEVRGNELLFRSAFTDIDADVKFIVNRGALSQHLILKERLPHPSVFGLNEDAHVEVMTEWLELPAHSKESRVIEPAANGQRALTHERISLGHMEFVGGHAFDIQGNASIPVASSLETIDNRNFLLEKIPWRKFAPENQQLPEPQAAIRKPAPAQAQVGRDVEGRTPVPEPLRVGRAVPSAPPQGGRASPRAALSPKVQSSIHPSIQPRKPQAARPLPARRTVKRTVKPIQMAEAAFVHSRALVWDWELVATVNKQVWRPDSTYYVSGSVTIITNEFWGGTVIKFAPTNSAKITINGPITSYAGMYQPITLTARDDHSIGDAVGTNLLSGLYGDKYLLLDAWTYGDVYTLEHFRLRHANTAIFLQYGEGHIFRHLQIVNSKVALNLYGGGLEVDNGLFYNCQTNIVGSGVPPFTAINCTFYTNLAFNHDGGASPVLLTNCILAEISGTGSYSGENNYAFSSGSSVFAPRLAGKAYLLSSSSARDGGTTNIPSTLLADLRQRSTAPPLVISNNVTLDTVWTRQVLRDTDQLDAGYHYDPIDLAISSVGVSNATLVITGGVAVALFGYNGIYVQANSRLVSAGTPHNLNRFLHYTAVQEQPDFYFDPNIARSVFASWSGSVTPPSMDFRWTAFDVAGYWYPAHLYADYGSGSLTNVIVRDCQFRAGQIALYENDSGACAFTNNLFEYVVLLADDNKYLRFHNNLFRTVVGFLSQSLTNQNWSFTDNLLDNSPFVNYSAGMIRDHNAYYNSADFYSVHNTNANEKILTSLSYDTGRLARYYLPTNSALLNAGSTTNAALVGLYHFTVLTNHVRELTNHLDISWHLPALDSSGWLLDQDLDAIPDAFEDRNGSGTYDSALGETDWQTYNSLFGIGPGPGLVVFTPLK